MDIPAFYEHLRKAEIEWLGNTDPRTLSHPTTWSRTDAERYLDKIRLRAVKVLLAYDVTRRLIPKEKR